MMFDLILDHVSFLEGFVTGACAALLGLGIFFIVLDKYERMKIGL